LGYALSYRFIQRLRQFLHNGQNPWVAGNRFACDAWFHTCC
jgi:hypothetical protein